MEQFDLFAPEPKKEIIQDTQVPVIRETGIWDGEKFRFVLSDELLEFEFNHPELTGQEINNMFLKEKDRQN